MPGPGNRSAAIALVIVLLCGLPEKVFAGNGLTVAVAANFAPAFEVMRERFTAATGIPVQVTVSSSGRHYALIKRKAPFDLFFSADSARPAMLHEEGLCSEPILYATGKSVLWSENMKFCRMMDWQEVVSSAEVKNIAMAKPEIAPYGDVARETLLKSNVWSTITGKVVYGNNVGQTFQYAATGAVDAAFISLSLARTEKGRAGCSWEIPEARHVEQKACMVRYSPNQAEALQFLQFAQSEQMMEILEEYGYER